MDQLEQGRFAAEEQWRAYAMGEEGGSYYGQEEEAYRAGRIARRQAARQASHAAHGTRDVAQAGWLVGALQQIGRRLGRWRIRTESG
ncbi:hypothetical protein [Chitinimonas naiadis]